jgi:hypothetical protein
VDVGKHPTTLDSGLSDRCPSYMGQFAQIDLSEGVRFRNLAIGKLTIESFRIGEGEAPTPATSRDSGFLVSLHTSHPIHTA